MGMKMVVGRRPWRRGAHRSSIHRWLCSSWLRCFARLLEPGKDDYIGLSLYCKCFLTDWSWSEHILRIHQVLSLPDSNRLYLWECCQARYRYVGSRRCEWRRALSLCSWPEWAFKSHPGSRLGCSPSETVGHQSFWRKWLRRQIDRPQMSLST